MKKVGIAVIAVKLTRQETSAACCTPLDFDIASNEAGLRNWSNHDGGRAIAILRGLFQWVKGYQLFFSRSRQFGVPWREILQFDMADIDFKEASEAVKRASEMSNDDKLELYALFKQATVGQFRIWTEPKHFWHFFVTSPGPCNTAKPGMFDVVGKAKW